MKNQRIKADNVDQLLEIVKAVQRGEDPGEALEKVKAEKEKAEAIAMAEALAAAEEEKRAAQERKAAGKKKATQDIELPEESDEFEKALETEKADSLPLKETARQMKESFRKAAGAFWKGSGKTGNKKKKKEAAAEETEDLLQDDVQTEAVDAPLRDDVQAEPVNELPQNDAQMYQENEMLQKDTQAEQPESMEDDLQESISEENTKADAESDTESETEAAAEQVQIKIDRLFEMGLGGERMLGRERLSDHAKHVGGEHRGVKKAELLSETETEHDSLNELQNHETEKVRKKVRKKGPGIAAVFAGLRKTLSEKMQDDELDEESAEESVESAEEVSEQLPEASDKFSETEWEKDAEKASEEASNEEKESIVETEVEQDTESEKEETDTSTKKKLPKKNVSIQKSVQKSIKKFCHALKNKEISKRGLTMLAAAGVLILLLIVAVVNIVQYSIDQKKKRENVAADKGLVVTVENDPQEWCSSYMLELRFKTKGKPITKVIINGTSLQPDAEGNVVYTASEYRLEATAVTEDTTYQAVIEIPKLDALPPVIRAERSGAQIILTASDDRSSIRKIWYAELEDHDFIRLPVYQEYTGAIQYHADSLYYFYAEDAAGNCSAPVITTMEQLETLQFSEESVMLYPEETVSLDVQAVPEKALLNGLQFTSSDPSVVAVDAKGRVTAMAEGKATITASAEGISDISCLVEVARERTVTISAIGDCTLGADQSFNTTINFDAFAAMNGNAYFFQNVADILENDDATFANLEGTLTTSTARAAKQYAFKGDPSYTEILTSGSVDVVTLANNHSSDYGDQSLSDTQQYLTEAGIDYCMGDTYVVKNVNGVKTAFIGIYVLRDGMERETQVRETIASAKEDGADLIIVGFHWGSEKATTPDETQKSLAHTAVDCGADLVVGHHPHVLQGIEKYNGTYIVYSLGNFCFGGNTAPSDTDTIIFRQIFTIRDGEVQDNDQIGIVPCSITSVDGYNDYMPTPANEDRAQRIMERINQYSEQFGQTYTASTGLE